MDKKAAILRATSFEAETDFRKRKAISIEPGRDFENVLAEWHSATLQLEQAHETLHEEVRQLRCELEEKKRRLTEGHDTTGLGRMVSRIAAELRNQLAPVTLNLSLLRRRIADDPIGLRLLEKVESGVTATEATVGDLLHLSSQREARPRSFSLSALVNDILLSLGSRIALQSIVTVIDIPESQSIRADRDMIRQALVNLVLNALDAMPDGGTMTITSAWTEQGLEIEVADTGPGLPESAEHHVFEPFFSTKSCGMGLGLAVVHRMTEVHGGYVTAMNCPEGGAAFTICIPQLALKAAA